MELETKICINMFYCRRASLGEKKMMKEGIKENMQRERAEQGLKVKFQSWLNPQIKDGVWVSSYFNNDPGYFNKHTWQTQSIATTGKDQGQRNSYFLLFGVKTDITTLEKSLILHNKAEHVCAPWPCIFTVTCPGQTFKHVYQEC